MAKHEAYFPLNYGISHKVPLQVEPLAQRSDDNSTGASPSSISTTHSPRIPFVKERSPSQEFDFLENDEEREPASGPQRSRSVSSLKSEKDKRKRSRVTPDQLAQLEVIFATDRSPTASRRKVISESLGMQERQTQIWFQNRRAKAKLLDGKQKGRSASLEAPPNTPPKLSTGFEVDLHNLIHEDEPVTIIPCTDLTIGTWRRIATTIGKHDLVAYVCDVKRCLTWFIRSGGFGFKMEIPFDTIIDTEFRNEAPASGTAAFLLSEPPMFFLENISSPQVDGSVSRIWKRCSDWTEGQQATRVLRHTLVGSAVQLAHLLRNIRTSATTSEIPLRAPSYQTANTPTSPVEFALSPVAPLPGPGYHYASNALSSSPHRPALTHRSSSSGSIAAPTFEPHYSTQSIRRPLLGHSSSISHLEHPYSSVRRNSSTNINLPPYEEYYTRAHSARSPSQYSSLPTAHRLPPRPYAIQTVSTPPYREDSRTAVPHEIGVSQRSTSSHFGQQLEASPPSPPILTIPYYPPPHMIENPPAAQASHNLVAPSPITSDFPSLLHGSDGELRYPRET